MLELGRSGDHGTERVLARHTSRWRDTRPVELDGMPVLVRRSAAAAGA